MKQKQLTLALIFLFCGLWLISRPVQAAPTITQTNPTATVITGALNVRSGPGVGYQVLAVIYEGQNVSLLGRNSASSWVKVRTANNVEGWVNASLLQSNVAIGSLPVADSNIAPPPATAIVTTGALNVRSGPGVAYGVVTTLTIGQNVTLLGRNEASSWVKVRASGGQEGWVNAAYLQASIAIGSLPVINSGPPPTTANAVITTGAANVRSGPGLGYGVVTIVYQGQTVSLLGRNSEASWVKVRTAGGQEGWVNVSLLQANVPIGSLTVMDSGLPTAWAIVISGAANVRSGPGIGYGSVAVVYQNEVVTLLGRNNNLSWVQVRLANGVTGWINASLLDANIAIGTLPVTG